MVNIKKGIAVAVMAIGLVAGLSAVGLWLTFGYWLSGYVTTGYANNAGLFIGASVVMMLWLLATAAAALEGATHIAEDD